MIDIAAIGGGLLSQGLGGLVGGLFQNNANNKQLEQQSKLMDLQAFYNRQMLDYQNERAFDLANRMSYKWQVEQMKKAGLNVGLMYSKGGGSQPTMGTGSANVNAPQAMPQTMVMDMAAQTANIELAKAQAEKAKAEAKKISGVDTMIGEKTIENLTQGIENMKVRQRLEATQANIADIDEAIKAGTFEEALSIIRNTSRQLNAAANIAEGDSDVNKATVNTRINTAKQELINKTIEADVMKQGIEVDKATINKMSQDIKQGWKKLSIDEQNAVTNYLNYTVNAQNANTRVKEYIESVRNNDMIHGDKQDMLQFEKLIKDVPESDKMTMDGIKSLIGLGLLGGVGGKIFEPKRNPIGFKR